MVIIIAKLTLIVNVLVVLMMSLEHILVMLEVIRLDLLLDAIFACLGYPFLMVILGDLLLFERARLIVITRFASKSD